MLQYFAYLEAPRGLWRIRVDKPQGDGLHHQRHVHIWRKDHDGVYSWNEDGTRHDKAKFPNSERYLLKAKSIAAEHLKVGPESLQFVLQVSGRSLVTGYTDAPEGERPRKIYGGYIRVNEHLIILETEQGGACFVVLGEPSMEQEV